MRATQIGGDGRFEKLILAVQALRLERGLQEERTERVQAMRAAAEEIFKIDGVPEPVQAAPLRAEGEAGGAVERGADPPATAAPTPPAERPRAAGETAPAAPAGPPSGAPQGQSG